MAHSFAHVEPFLYAYETNNIVNAFRAFDKLSDPKNQKLIKKEKTKTVRTMTESKTNLSNPTADFVRDISDFLQAFLVFQKSKGNCSIALIFYERMCFSRDIVLAVKNQQYRYSLQMYIRNSDLLPAEKKQILLRTAHAIIEYLEGHMIDTDNCLIGLAPTDDFLTKIKRLDTSDPVEITREVLVSQILTWSWMGEADLLSSVSHFASQLRGVQDIHSGDLVVVATKGFSMFARVEGEKHEDYIMVWTDASETKTTSVAVEHVYPLPKNIIESLKDIKSMEKIVKQHVEPFYSSLHQEVKERVLTLLEGLGVDVQLLKRAADEKINLHDLERLKKMSRLLSEFSDSSTLTLFRDTEDFMRDKVQAYITALDTRQLFMPRYEATMNELGNYYKLPLARSRVRQQLGACELAIDNLKHEMRTFLNGSQKAEMTEWWLKRIETSVNEFLKKLGYDFAAVPDHYIEQPPASMAPVVTNLALVLSIINCDANPDKSPAELIAQLKEDIYPTIDDFMRRAIIVLCEYCAYTPAECWTCPRGNGKLLLDEHGEELEGLTTQLKLSLQCQREDLPAEAIEQLSDLISDLGYLLEMRKLEDQPTKNLHVVPVTGLIMGSFVRLENELRTVIELWGDPPAPEVEPEQQQVSKPDIAALEDAYLNVEESETEDEGEVGWADLFDGKTPLHMAVCSDKVVTVAEKLLTHRASINVADKSGFTPLHTACLLGNWDICELLLADDTIDVTVRTNDKSSVLHHLVRQSPCDKQLSVLNKILTLGAPVSAQNRHGETPLHYASLKGHVEAMGELIAHGADLNCRAFSNDAALHYAVTAGHADAVDLLLKSGADVTLSARRGTPLDIAKIYKRERIVKLLEDKLGTQAMRTGFPTTTSYDPAPSSGSSVEEDEAAVRKRVLIGLRIKKHRSNTSRAGPPQEEPKNTEELTEILGSLAPTFFEKLKVKAESSAAPMDPPKFSVELGSSSDEQKTSWVRVATPSSSFTNSPRGSQSNGFSSADEQTESKNWTSAKASFRKAGRSSVILTGRKMSESDELLPVAGSSTSTNSSPNSSPVILSPRSDNGSENGTSAFPPMPGRPPPSPGGKSVSRIKIIPAPRTTKYQATVEKVEKMSHHTTETTTTSTVTTTTITTTTNTSSDSNPTTPVMSPVLSPRSLENSPVTGRALPKTPIKSRVISASKPKGGSMGTATTSYTQRPVLPPSFTASLLREIPLRKSQEAVPVSEADEPERPAVGTRPPRPERTFSERNVSIEAPEVPDRPETERSERKSAPKFDKMLSTPVLPVHNVGKPPPTNATNQRPVLLPGLNEVLSVKLKQRAGNIPLN